MTNVAVLFFLILLNGVLALAEAALMSARKARLQGLADDGDKAAQIALELANEPMAFLSTVQIGITLVGILAGAFGEATLAGQLATLLERAPLLAPYSRALSLVIVVIIVAYVSLVLGELAPKRLALYNPERLASLVAPPMRVLSRWASPAVRFLSFSASLVLRLFGITDIKDAPVTEDELKVLIAQGTAAGVFDAAEQNIMRRTLRLGDRTAATLMTPRPDIVWLDLDDDPAEVWRKITTTTFTRFPVARGALDAIAGVVRARDLLTSAGRGDSLSLESVLQPPLLVPESTPALRVLEILKRARSQMALILDEYGGVSGLVTLEDILQAIVGDISDEAQPTEAVRRLDGSWLLDGALPVDEMQELLDLDDLPGAGDYLTVAGFIMRQLGHIPSAGDRFTWENCEFEVVDMDGRRVDKVLVSERGETIGVS
ncbi:MAG: hemolysin family protein [Anaerolineae bacterium]|jgi:putative hemolysin|uniref:hemolysin family protein n=1 Tax=Candidatus Amarolinea dominans TaxID=3140696 RepID=UPI003135EC25|nr:HlyC/CorC family transporter [Anaerolineae bacterium]MBK9230312.1 HlyC/CorC family transporter [Anaerolineae bacterium]